MLSSSKTLAEKNNSIKSNAILIVGSLFGNMMEYFDFTLYSIFAISLGKAFFPNHAIETQEILSFVIFAIGFVTRPLGGIVFGYIGTYLSRKTSLILSSLFMSLSTLSIGFIPSSEEIGIKATYLLILIRAIQGLCVSGEGAVIAVYLLGKIKSVRHGLITGIVHGSNLAGTVLAGILGLYIHYHNLDWRIGFIIGGTMSFIGLILRLAIKDEENVSQEKPAVAANLLKHHKQILLTVAMAGLASSMTYTGKSYLNIFFANKYQNTGYGIWYTTIIGTMIMILMPIAGLLNDRLGPQKLLRRVLWSIALFIIPTFLLMENNNFYVEFIGIFIFCSMTANAATTSYLFCIKLFANQYRFFNIGFGYNLGVALLGGTTPAISAYLVSILKFSYAPSLYILFNVMIVAWLLNRNKIKLLDI